MKQQLQRLLTRPQIGTVQQTVGSQHRSQGDAGKIHPLGQHLGSDQHICLPGCEAVQKTAMSIATTGGITIETQQAQILQLLRQQLEHPLGASTERLERRRTAMRAAAFDLSPVIAPVTAKPLTSALAAMHGERHIAVGALHHLTAAATTEKRAVTTTGHQHNSLLALLRQFLETFHQRPADQAAMSFRQFVPHVHHMHGRQGLLGNTTA